MSPKNNIGDNEGKFIWEKSSPHIYVISSLPIEKKAILASLHIFSTKNLSTRFFAYCNVFIWL